MDCCRFKGPLVLDISYILYSLRSSTNNLTLVIPQHIETILLMNMRKSIRPKTDPWGKPLITSAARDEKHFSDITR